jgi:hypothetical protein
VANNTPNPRGLYGNNNFENEPSSSASPVAPSSTSNALTPLSPTNLVITPTTSVIDSVKIMSEKAGIALPPTLTLAEIDTLLKGEKKLYLRIHPNKGGDPEKFKATRELFDELRRIKEETTSGKKLEETLQEAIGNTSSLLKNIAIENNSAAGTTNNSIYNLPTNIVKKKLSNNRSVTPLNTKVNLTVKQSANRNKNTTNTNNRNLLPGMVNDKPYVKPPKTPFQRFVRGAETRLKRLTEKKKPLSTKPPGQRGGKRTRKNKKSE